MQIISILETDNRGITFVFPANGKNSASAVCRLTFVRGNEKIYNQFQKELKHFFFPHRYTQFPLSP